MMSCVLFTPELHVLKNKDMSYFLKLLNVWRQKQQQQQKTKTNCDSQICQSFSGESLYNEKPENMLS